MQNNKALAAMTEGFIKRLADRPIAFQRSFVSLGAGVTGALLLSQAVYWSARTSNEDGWFYKSREDWEEETGLTRREQEGARSRLKGLGVLEEKLKGVPATVNFRINFSRLGELLGVPTSLHETAQLDGTKAPNKKGGKRQTNTETTPETTSETTTSSSEADASPTPEDLFPDAQSAVDEVVQAYNEILAPLGCPKVKRVNDQRKRLVARALKISKKHRDPKWWRTKFFPHVAATTRLTKGNGKYGPMGFDHMMRPDVVTRIEEGYYFADSKRD